MQLSRSVLSLAVAALAGFSSVGHSAAQQRYGICAGEKLVPPALLILSHNDSEPCFRALRRTDRQLPDADSKDANPVTAEDSSGSAGYRLAYATSAEDAGLYDHILGIKERHFPLSAEKTAAGLQFTQEVVLTRKGEDFTHVASGGGKIDRQGIVTMCGRRFYEDLEMLLARKRIPVTVPLAVYNSYHKQVAPFASGGLAFFHVQFRDSTGTCVASNDTAGGRISARRMSFAFPELGINAQPSFIARVVGFSSTAQAANDRYTTLISRISSSYERNGYLISEFLSPVRTGTGAHITITHLALEPDEFGNLPTTYWQIERR